MLNKKLGTDLKEIKLTKRYKYNILSALWWRLAIYSQT